MQHRRADKPAKNVPGWTSFKTLVSVTAYHSFAGEVEVRTPPTIRRLPSFRHQLLRIARQASVEGLLRRIILASRS